MRLLARFGLLSALGMGLLASCSKTEDAPLPPRVTFGPMGRLTGAAGKGSFRFGAATAATQIEDQNARTDWWFFTAPVDQGGLGKHTFVGDGSKGFSMAQQDVQLAKDTQLDAYRFSVEWARVEPERGKIDEAALAHYRSVLTALRAQGIRPMITLHHFSNPVWVADPRDPDCASGPSDKNLCGLGHPQGGPLVAEAMGKFAKLMGERFGDLVDEWGTLNEPVNYLLAAYGIGLFPPAKSHVLGGKVLELFVPTVRDYLQAHANMYRALKVADTVDADGDGEAATVGLTLSVADWVPSRSGALSQEAADVRARDNVVYVYHHLVVEALRQGAFDANIDRTFEEPHADWKGTLDWLGVQYYFRAGVTGTPAFIKVIDATPCSGTADFGACVPPVTDITHCVPEMKYEFHEPGLYDVLKDFGTRWGDLPLLVSESGLATNTGKRRSEHIVRSLEQIARAQADGVDVRGYYHWSLVDNFEWAEGYKPKFGLYSVDRSSFARTATAGQSTLAEIARARALSPEHRRDLGGLGPMTPDAEAVEGATYCTGR